MIRRTDLTRQTSCQKDYRATSLPEPNGIPYKVYKNCLRLTQLLWKHLRVVWRKGISYYLTPS